MPVPMAPGNRPRRGLLWRAARSPARHALRGGGRRSAAGRNATARAHARRRPPATPRNPDRPSRAPVGNTYVAGIALRTLQLPRGGSVTGSGENDGVAAGKVVPSAPRATTRAGPRRIIRGTGFGVEVSVDQ